jgi:hypothetical protein
MSALVAFFVAVAVITEFFTFPTSFLFSVYSDGLFVYLALCF